MEKNNKQKSASALIGAAFLMATSAIGPGFSYTDRTVHRKPQRKLWLRNLNISYF